jgi:hypothetical protein
MDDVLSGLGIAAGALVVVLLRWAIRRLRARGLPWDLRAFPGLDLPDGAITTHEDRAGRPWRARDRLRGRLILSLLGRWRLSRAGAVIRVWWERRKNGE